MSQKEAAKAKGEEQLLTQWRRVKQALKEAKIIVKNMHTLRKSSKLRGNQLHVEKFFEGCGTRSERFCQVRQQHVHEQRNLGHDGSEATVRVGSHDPTGLRLGDTEQAVSVITRTELTREWCW